MKTSNHASFKGLFVILIVLLVVSACAEPTKSSEPTELPSATAEPVIALQPTATLRSAATLRPTNTLAPIATLTLVMPDTPIPVDTATSDMAATATIQATEAVTGESAAIADDLQKYGFSIDQGQLGWQQSSNVTLTMQSYQEEQFKLFDEGLFAGDFVLQTEITWESKGGLAVCGIILRSEADLENGRQYRYQIIRLSGYPAYDIEYFDNGRWVATLGGQPSTLRSLKQENGSTNILALVVEGDRFTPYINGEMLKTKIDSRSREGTFGFYGWQDSGETSCSFDNTWVWVLK